MENVPHDLVIFTESEKGTIKKEFTYNNVRRLNWNFMHYSQASNDSHQTQERYFTEHPLDSTNNELLRNATTKSVILAPFNTTIK